MNPTIKAVVLDALYERDMVGQGCFWENRAAEVVEHGPVSNLSVIEEVIREELAETCPWDEATRYFLFPGLDDVLHAYFNLADKKGCLSQAASFLMSLAGAARLVALDTIKRKECCQSEPLADAIREIARTATMREREVAKRILGEEG